MTPKFLRRAARKLKRLQQDLSRKQRGSNNRKKAARYGRTFGRIDRFFPSTRMCSGCGRINDKMALNVRAWDCPCGSHTLGT
ncbi:MAG: zinc ribbon domain-containing protein [Actinoallomurus sp.]